MTSACQMDSLILQKVKDEVDRLHAFFVDWFHGRVPKDTFSDECPAYMHAHFHLINPQGILTSKKDLVPALEKAYGCRKDQEFEIWCENVQILHCDGISTDVDPSPIGGVILCSYEEVQALPDNVRTRRLATAAFATSSKDMNTLTDGRLLWLHVHETWIEAPPSEQHMWKPSE